MFTHVAARTVRCFPIRVFSRGASGHLSPPDPPPHGAVTDHAAPVYIRGDVLEVLEGWINRLDPPPLVDVVARTQTPPVGLVMKLGVSDVRFADSVIKYVLANAMLSRRGTKVVSASSPLTCITAR